VVAVVVGVVGPALVPLAVVVRGRDAVGVRTDSRCAECGARLSSSSYSSD
jgi:hypothetical protein